MKAIFKTMAFSLVFLLIISPISYAASKEELQNQAANLAHISNPSERLKSIKTELKKLSSPKDKIWLMRYTIRILKQQQKSVLPLYTANEENQILALVNSEREKDGLDPLVLNETLNQVAQAHADYMKDTGDFEHVSKDGISPFDRMDAAGYEYKSAGENIAWGQESPEEVMQDWMDSPGHRENILRDNFEELGIGIACKEEHRCYWVQEFGGR